MKATLLYHGPLETVPVLRNLSSLLSERGHSVEVVAYTDRPPSNVRTAASGVREYAIYRGGEGITPRPLRAAVRFCRFGCASRKIMSDHVPDVVVAFNYDGLALALALRRQRSRVVYYVLEYSEAPRAHDFWTGWGFLKLLERRLVRRSDCIVSVDAARAVLQGKEWNLDTPMVVLNAPRFDSATERAAQMRLTGVHSGPLRLVYAGTVSEGNLITELVEAVNDLDGDVHLDIYGPVTMSYKRDFIALLGERRPDRQTVRYRGEVKYGELAPVLVTYDVGVVLYPMSVVDDVNVQLASPAKLLEYMKAGLAVVATSQPMARRVIGANNAGWLLEDVGTLPALLREIVANRDEVHRRGSLGLSAFGDRLTYEDAASALLEAIDQLGRPPHSRR